MADTSNTPSGIEPGKPTASVGLDPVEGKGEHYMRSDAAPKLDQGITPTWTGNHTFRADILVPDRNSGDSSAHAANTKFVKDAIDRIGSYSLPPASEKTRGGVRIGSGLSIRDGDVLSASFSGGFTALHQDGGSGVIKIGYSMNDIVLKGTSTIYLPSVNDMNYCKIYLTLEKKPIACTLVPASDETIDDKSMISANIDHVYTLLEFSRIESQRGWRSSYQIISRIS